MVESHDLILGGKLSNISFAKFRNVGFSLMVNYVGGNITTRVRFLREEK